MRAWKPLRGLPQRWPHRPAPAPAPTQAPSYFPRQWLSSPTLFSTLPITGTVSLQVGTALLVEGAPTLPNILARCSLPGGELAASTHSMAQEMVRALETIAMRGCALVGNLAPCVPSGSKASQHVYVHIYDM